MFRIEPLNPALAHCLRHLKSPRTVSYLSSPFGKWYRSQMLLFPDVE